jgi:hypothetical protein
MYQEPGTTNGEQLMETNNDAHIFMHLRLNMTFTDLFAPFSIVLGTILLRKK